MREGGAQPHAQPADGEPGDSEGENDDNASYQRLKAALESAMGDSPLPEACREDVLFTNFAAAIDTLIVGSASSVERFWIQLVCSLRFKSHVVNVGLRSSHVRCLFECSCKCCALESMQQLSDAYHIVASDVFACFSLAPR